MTLSLPEFAVLLLPILSQRITVSAENTFPLSGIQFHAEFFRLLRYLKSLFWRFEG